MPTYTNEPADYAQMLEMNEALVLGSVRQHELTEAAEHSNAQLLAEMNVRRAAEEALRRSEEQFASIFNQTTGGIAEVDLSGRFVLVNDRFCQLLDRSREELLRLRMQEVTHPEDLAENVVKFGALIAGSLPSFVLEKRYLRPDGALLWVQADVASIRDAQGRVRSVTAAVTDITGRRALEGALAARVAQLARADRSKDEFLATLAHELRNPLAPLPMVVALLRSTTDAALIVEGCDVIERQVKQLVHLVEDLLDVARINEGKIALRLERCDLAAPLRAALDSSRPAVESARHRLHVTWPEGPLEVDGDQVRLTQIFVNLLNNAAKYSNPGGHISVVMQREGAGALVRVNDKGYGIAPEVLPHVFDLFTQSHQAGRARGGLGIGLNVVKRMVEMHGGSVSVKSALGVGSEFTVRLPLAAVPAARHSPAAAATLGRLSELRRVLVVDDNVDAAKILGAMLQGQGHDVRVVHEGRAAIAAAPEFHPDTVLLDLGLPDVDGWEVARALRERFPELLLVAITGWGKDEDRTRSREAGFDHHLVKPVEPATLRDVLAR